MAPCSSIRRHRRAHRRADRGTHPAPEGKAQGVKSVVVTVSGYARHQYFIKMGRGVSLAREAYGKPINK